MRQMDEPADSPGMLDDIESARRLMFITPELPALERVGSVQQGMTGSHLANTIPYRDMQFEVSKGAFTALGSLLVSFSVAGICGQRPGSLAADPGVRTAVSRAARQRSERQPDQRPHRRQPALWGKRGGERRARIASDGRCGSWYAPAAKEFHVLDAPLAVL
ncbi:hypothetical protein Sfulv_50220 [Streptomyces fulvorobeus]|uniref:Uncharacterized protein n=1 Tax=Streptomyces fulvorobeus TaxID=284028 RepID=A0A7J0CCG6_9ACTN|nr:hypothetical protein Sfulv_50220 [Streptomyces fulvorobeus]